MPLAEIFHRFKEAATKRFLLKSPEAYSPLTPKSSPSLEEVLRDCPRDFLESSVEAFREGVFIYGFPWPRDLAGNLKWNSFLSGHDTSNQPCFKVSYRGRGDVASDIRLPWELNRLTWLLPVAAAARSGNEDAAQIVVREVLSFLDSDVPGTTLRWNSAIELAMQSLALSCIDAFMADSKAWAGLQGRMRWALAHRYRWLQRWPSKYSSANNHRLAELAALVVLEEIYEPHPVVSPHSAELMNEVRKQFLADGFNAELSFDYHLYALDLLITVRWLAPHSSASIGLEGELARIGETTSKILATVGAWPSANDSDEALLLGMLVPRAQAPAFLARLCGAGVRDAWPESIWSLSQAGYSFLSHGPDESKVSVILDHGKIGYGQIAAHGHSDVLSIWVHVAGEAWLVEAGTYCYHAEAALRDELRSSHMHNTITLGGESLSDPLGPFLWNPDACAFGVLDEIELEGSRLSAVATAHRRGTALARRRVFLNDAVLEVYDESLCDSAITSHFIVSPEFKVEPTFTPNLVSLTRSSGDRLRFQYDEEASVAVDTVRVSPRYGHLVDAARIRVQSAGGHRVRIDILSIS